MVGAGWEWLYRLTLTGYLPEYSTLGQQLVSAVEPFVLALKFNCLWLHSYIFRMELTLSILFQSGEGTSEAGAMETESTEESQPSSSSGGAEEGATPSTSTITPPTEEMEALYSEMDALNKLADYCVHC